MAMTAEQTAKMLIQYFNGRKGIVYKFADKNVNQIMTALEAGYDVPTLQKAVVEYDGKELMDCFSIVRLAEAGYEKEVPVAVEVPTPVVAPVAAAPQALGILEQAMAEIFTTKHADTISAAVMDKAVERLDTYIAKTYGMLPKKTLVEYDDKAVKIDGIVHEKFDEIMAFVRADEPVFITGPAGSGKNVLAKQVATAMEIPFYFSNAVTQEYKITGFTDAMGTFQESQFYKAFKDGGLFMLDEVDASIPEVLVILNAAIANRYFDFPAPIGYVEAHKDFRIIAAGNTYGTGASSEYVGRNQLDAATLDRFAIVEVGYSADIEIAVAMGNYELAKFCRSFRAAAEKAGIQIVVSYRSIGRIAKMEPALGTEKTLKTCLVKGIEADDLRVIKSNMPSSGKYIEALAKLC